MDWPELKGSVARGFVVLREGGSDLASTHTSCVGFTKAVAEAQRQGGPEGSATEGMQHAWSCTPHKGRPL